MAAIIIRRTTMKNLLRVVLALLVAILLSSAIGKSVSNSDSSEESGSFMSGMFDSLHQNFEEMGNLDVFQMSKTSRNTNCPKKPATNGRKSLSKNPEETGEHFEGDILLPKSTRRFISGKYALIDRNHLWPEGVIPYEIKGPFTDVEKAKIKKAMKQFHKHTCVRWKSRTEETSWVNITSDANDGCNSHIGRQGGPQLLNLHQSKCLHKTWTIMHEMMHTAGFRHEQTRYDRDEYITVNCENIKGGKEYNFNIMRSNYSTYGFPYDYGSLMQYSGLSFSANGKPTIVPKKRNAKIGQRKGFSAEDIEKIRKVYRCN